MRVLFLFLSLFLYLYLFWKKLKEDYPPNLIFTTAFYSVVAVGFANVISFYFFSGWWFWLSFLGLVLGLSTGIIRYKLKIFEVVETAVVAILPVLLLVFTYDAIKSLSMVSAIGSLVIIVAMLLFIFIDSRYKRFVWYKSGKVGFSGLTVLGLIFIARTVVAAVFIDVLSFVDPAEPFLSASVALLSFLGVYYLSRRKT
jgi:hypothetical protein